MSARFQLGVTLLIVCALSLVFGCGDEAASVAKTTGDLRAVHAQVFIGETEVRGEARVSAGQLLRTGPDGRARLRLDDGSIIAIDRNTELSLSDARLQLSRGRIFVQAGSEGATSVVVGDVSTRVAGSSAAFAAGEAGPQITVSNGELMLESGGQQTRVSSGETASLTAGKMNVVPEKAFDDWTGGLAAPWTSEVGAVSSIPDVRGVASGHETGSPLVVRAHRTEVEVDGELALTRSTTTFFNGASDATRVPVRLSLPEGAIVRSVKRRVKGSSESATIGISSSPSQPSGEMADGLEWAGGGWLRGDLRRVDAGETLELEIEYAQWLSARGSRVDYRYLMDGGSEPPLVGELDLTVRSKRPAVRVASSNFGALSESGELRYAGADVRPTSDFVVELDSAELHADKARAYVESDLEGGDKFVMFRTELPEAQDAALTLALVVDTSMSVGAATLETQRAVVDAILEGLSPADSVVVLAADQSLRALGPERPTPVTAESLARVREALSRLRPAGASNLGEALLGAADLLDAPGRGEQAGAGMLIYIGDGRPSVGATDARAIRRLLAKRSGGLPRLGAIAAGPNADRWLLAQLVAGVGQSYEVLDRTEAARAGAALLSEALKPTLRDVELDLGPGVDRIYPREVGAVRSGSTISVVGRLRGKLPSEVTLRFRRGAELVSHTKAVDSRPLPAAASLPQRWASERIAEMAIRDEGIEPAIALAFEAKLITPWTGWYFDADRASGSEPFAQRVLELSPQFDYAFGRRVAPVLASGSTLLEPRGAMTGGHSIVEATELAIRRTLQRAAKSIQACRDARLGVRPDLGTTFAIQLTVDAGGTVTTVQVTLQDTRGGDPVLERCIQGVVKALPFYASGAVVQATHSVTVAEGRSTQRTKCSEASKVSLPLRKSIWRERGLGPQGYLLASRQCELRRWKDKREYLLLLLESSRDGSSRLNWAAQLEQEGFSDAAEFVREQTLRDVESFEELQSLALVLRSSEPIIDEELKKAYVKAKTDELRLGVLREFLRLAPHSPLANRLLLSLLEAMGKTEALVAHIQALRSEPIVDAGLLALGASALRRNGREADGMRAFGELIERAPCDPWTLAYVGDRLRAEGLFDEAIAAYDSLSNLLPDEASVSLRQALAHAGAGRLDVATRLLERVTQTGGRGDDGRIGELASILRAFQLTRAKGNNSPEVETQLERRLLQTPLPDVEGLLLVESPPADDAVDVRIVRQDGERAEISPDFDATSLGIAAVRLERGAGATKIVLTRDEQLGPPQTRKIRVAALLFGQDRASAKLTERVIEVAADGKPVELELSGEQLL